MQSVEVLRDGASAQYGSDAIAGVVNLRLREARDGGGTDVTYGWRDTDFDVRTAPVTTPGATWSAPPVLSRSRSDGETLTASIWKGLPLTDSGFLTVAAEYKDQEHTERGGWDHRAAVSDREWRARSARGDVRSLQLLVRRARAGAEDAVRECGLRRLRSSRALRLGELAGPALGRRRLLSSRRRRAQHPVDLSRRLPAVDRRRRHRLLRCLRHALGARRVADGQLAGLRSEQDGVHDRSHAQSLDRADQQDEVRCRRLRLRPAGAERLRRASGGDRRLRFAAQRGSRSRGAARDVLDLRRRAGLVPQRRRAAGERRSRRARRAGVSGLPAVERSRRGPDRSGRLRRSRGEPDAGACSRRLPCAARAIRTSATTSPASCRCATTSTSTSRCAAPCRTASARRRCSSSSSRRRRRTTFPGVGLVEVTTFPASDPVARALGATDLDAEKSTNFSVGTVLRFGELDLTIDAYRIDIDDRIVLSENLTSAAVRAVPEPARASSASAAAASSSTAWTRAPKAWISC